MRLKLGLAIGVLLVLALATAVSADQSLTLVSQSPDGQVNGAEVAPVAVSDNGRFVAFASDSVLLPQDSNGYTDVYVRDTQTGLLELVSVSSGGAQGNQNSGTRDISISDDGRFVVFGSNASNLVAGDTNNNYDIFIHDRQTDQIQVVARDDGAIAGQAAEGSISGNGRYVVVAGQGYLAASPVSFGLFVFDRVSDTIEQIVDGPTTFSTPESARISDNGRFVAFQTREFDNNEDLILFDRNTDTWEIANPRTGGQAAQSRMGFHSLSGDGRYVAFDSVDTNLLGVNDAGGTMDAFVYDSTTNSLERVVTGGAGDTERPLPVLSDDGRFFTFITYNDIHGPANSNVPDVALYDRNSDSVTMISVRDDGTAAVGGSGFYLAQSAISGNARYVAFLTFESFDAGDAGDIDVYLADRQGELGAGDECTHDFTDVGSSNTFEDDICWLADQGITRGCNPPANTEFCPEDPVTRGQMAAFLVRALGYTDNGGGDLFDDDNDSVFEGDIDRLGTAGVTRGCNPPANNLYCPTDNVTRGQMAAFLVRALGYTDNGGGDLFDDDNDSVFEGDIDRLGTAGVTRGCNPPANNLFCPLDDVSREQMAAFLRRALEE